MTKEDRVSGESEHLSRFRFSYMKLGCFVGYFCNGLVQERVGPMTSSDLDPSF